MNTHFSIQHFYISLFSMKRLFNNFQFTFYIQHRFSIDHVACKHAKRLKYYLSQGQVE
jgi:hypothetical protein